MGRHARLGDDSWAFPYSHFTWPTSGCITALPPLSNGKDTSVRIAEAVLLVPRPS